MDGHRRVFNYPSDEETSVGNETSLLKQATPLPSRILSWSTADVMGARILISAPGGAIPHQEHANTHPSTRMSPLLLFLPPVPLLANSATPSDHSVAATELPALSYKDPLLDEDINRVFAIECSQVTDKDVLSDSTMQSHPGNIHHRALALHHFSHSEDFQKRYTAMRINLMIRNNGGRFLKRDAMYWYEIGDKNAISLTMSTARQPLASSVKHSASNNTNAGARYILLQRTLTKEDMFPQFGIETDGTDDATARIMFPGRLFRMLEDIDTRQENLSHIVSWHHSNLNFVVHFPHAFVREVLPIYFRRQTKLSSFQRQLRNYGFLQYQNQRNSGGIIYYHESFRRDKPSLLQHVVLRPSRKKKNTELLL